MQWIGFILKLLSWRMVGQKKRSAFPVGVVSNVCLGVPAYNAELYGVALACLCVALIQAHNWFTWNEDTETRTEGTESRRLAA